MKKRWMAVAAALLTAALAMGAEAAEQRAFSLEDSLTLYAKPDKAAKSWEVTLPEAGVEVPSAIRDKEDRLWDKVTVDGRTGWLYQEGVRLKMGPKSKAASNIYKRYAAARQKIAAGKVTKGWTQEEDVSVDGDAVRTWRSKGALFQVAGEGKGARDVYFVANTASACKTFLGFEAVGMDKNALRSKVGTPTVRETPSGGPEISILSYELSEQDMTLVFTLNSDVVESVELYSGGIGEAEEGWPEGVLELRNLD